MIDTITLRLHNLHKHKSFVKSLRKRAELSQKKDNKNMRRFLDIVDLDLIDLARLKGLKNTLKLDYLEHLNSGNKTIMYERKQLYMPSSQYSFMYVIKDDYIEFEFSIPKLLYGNNIAQFVTSPNSLFGSERNSFKFQKSKLFKRMFHSIKKLLSDISSDSYYDLSDLELKRLDLCYNQFFNTKKEALLFLDWQKNIWKKGVSNNSNKIVARRTTSIDYVGTGFYCKIYHKGSEYEKNDKPKHIKLNNEYRKKTAKNKEIKNKDLFEVHKLQKIADKILRYEVEFKSNFMAERFMKWEFRRKDKIHIQRKKLYKKISSNTRSGDEYLKEIILSWKDYNKNNYSKLAKFFLDKVERSLKRKLTTKDKKIINIGQSKEAEKFGKITHDKNNIYIHINNCTSKEFKFYKDFTNSLKKRRKLKFKSTLEEIEWYNYDKGGSMTENMDVKITPRLLGMFVDYFENFIMSYQVKNLPDMTETLKKVDNFNAEMKLNRKNAKLLCENPNKYQGMNKTKIMMVLKLVQKFPLKEALSMLGVDKRTEQRYKAQLKKLDIDNRNCGYSDIMTNLKTDFEIYYSIAESQTKILYPNKKSFFF